MCGNLPIYVVLNNNVRLTLFYLDFYFIEFTLFFQIFLEARDDNQKKFVPAHTRTFYTKEFSTNSWFKLMVNLQVYLRRMCMRDNERQLWSHNHEYFFFYMLQSAPTNKSRMRPFSTRDEIFLFL